MKKFKTLWLTGLACFLALSVVHSNAWAPIRINSTKTIEKIDPLISKVIKAIEASVVDKYPYTKNRIIRFDFSVVPSRKHDRPFFKISIHELTTKNLSPGREIQTAKSTIIIDFLLNGLDNKDVIIYEKVVDAPNGRTITGGNHKFGELSVLDQQEIRIEYEKILKEAPDKLMAKLTKQQKEKKEKMRKFGTNILDMMRKK